MYFYQFSNTCFSKIAKVLSSFIQYSCLAHCVLEYGGDFVVCTGPSMEPTILSENIVLSEHMSPRLNQIKCGDIIIAKSPSNHRQFICKRVTGLPGDTIRVGYKLHVVPRGHVWLEGDNRSNSSDSRTYGAIPYGLIRGRVVCRVWPPQQVSMLTPDYTTKSKTSCVSSS